MPTDIPVVDGAIHGTEHVAEKGKAGLTKRVGPLPVWAWALAGVAGVAIGWRLMHASRTAAVGGAGASSGAGAGGSGGGDSPPPSPAPGALTFPSGPGVLVPAGSGQSTFPVSGVNSGAGAFNPLPPTLPGQRIDYAPTITQTGPNSAMISTGPAVPQAQLNAPVLPGVFTGDPAYDNPIITGLAHDLTPISQGGIDVWNPGVVGSLASYQQIAEQQVAAGALTAPAAPAA